jgi:hypothetical protein
LLNRLRAVGIRRDVRLADRQRYLLANPFAGVKFRGTRRSTVLDTSHVFIEGEWMLVRMIAEGLEKSHGWEAAAQPALRGGLRVCNRPARERTGRRLLATSKPTPGAIIG